ncbi:MAG: MarR family winged helix-turn-helix transcriptional regulator, partial [Acidimicrobiales bacterium]
MLAAELRRQLRSLIAGEPWMTEAGFRPPCIGVLQTVARHGPISQRDISERLAIDPSDVVGALDILERVSMVERGRDPNDRRRHAVVVTGRGERAAGRLAAL